MDSRKVYFLSALGVVGVGVAWVVSGVVSVGLLLALRGLVAKPPWLWVVGGVRGCGRWIGMLF